MGLGVKPAPAVIGQEAGKHSHTLTLKVASESPVRLMIMSLGGERKRFVEIWTLSRRFFLDEPTTLRLHDIVWFVVRCEGCFDKHIYYISLLFIQSCHLVNRTIISNQSLCSCTLLSWTLMYLFHTATTLK